MVSTLEMLITSHPTLVAKSGWHAKCILCDTANGIADGGLVALDVVRNSGEASLVLGRIDCRQVDWILHVLREIGGKAISSPVKSVITTAIARCHKVAHLMSPLSENMRLVMAHLMLAWATEFCWRDSTKVSLWSSSQLRVDVRIPLVMVCQVMHPSAKMGPCGSDLSSLGSTSSCVLHASHI
jgi:hypothetical protein